MKFKIVFSFLGFLLILLIGLPILKILLSTDVSELINTTLQPEVYQSIGLTLRASLWATLAALLV
ncbi:MAG: molybdenum ABC transporter permease, partial [Candidatus Aminicenantes bacterium]|nr:molybdenum ABC transporter permease [Candidatus Aminicenantes bacterium]